MRLKMPDDWAITQESEKPIQSFLSDVITEWVGAVEVIIDVVIDVFIIDSLSFRRFLVTNGSFSTTPRLNRHQKQCQTRVHGIHIQRHTIRGEDFFFSLDGVEKLVFAGRLDTTVDELLASSSESSSIS